MEDVHCPKEGLRTGLGFDDDRMWWKDAKQWSMPEKWSAVLRGGVRMESRSNGQRSPCHGLRITCGENEAMVPQVT